MKPGTIIILMIYLSNSSPDKSVLFYESSVSEWVSESVVRSVSPTDERNLYLCIACLRLRQFIFVSIFYLFFLFVAVTTPALLQLDSALDSEQGANLRGPSCSTELAIGLLLFPWNARYKTRLQTLWPCILHAFSHRGCAQDLFP